MSPPRRALCATALIVLALLAAPPRAFAEGSSQCAASAAAGGEDPGACAAAADDDSSLLATRSARHSAPQARAEVSGAGLWGGRCCHGLDTCPSELGKEDAWVRGCLPADDPCSSSAAKCKSAACRCGMGRKSRYCPVTTSTCALGENIRVVTDMGFDDWGAFSVLNAAGCTPQKALGVEGMMPSNFAGNFSKLLQSWFGDLTKVYQGPPDGSCYGDYADESHCYPKFCWLETTEECGPGYRPRIFENLPLATKFPWAEVNDWPDEVSNDADEFWGCEPGEEYTLLVISPQSAVASRLLDPKKGAATRKCIKEIVFMGGLFGNEQLNSVDPATALSMEGPLTNVSNYDDPSKLTEVNVVSDVNAAHATWGIKGVPMRILSLETASCARVGLQKIQFSGQTGMYNSTDQLAKEDETIEKVRASLDCQNPPNMLTKMVCMHKGCDIATLDFDVVAGTYVWLGDADKTVHFHFKQILPSVNPTTAVTTSTYDNSTDVWIATAFDAPAWLEVLVGKLNGK